MKTILSRNLLSKARATQTCLVDFFIRPPFFLCVLLFVCLHHSVCGSRGVRLRNGGSIRRAIGEAHFTANWALWLAFYHRRFYPKRECRKNRLFLADCLRLLERRNHKIGLEHIFFVSLKLIFFLAQLFCWRVKGFFFWRNEIFWVILNLMN